MQEIKEKLEDFLKETEYCDISHSSIQKLAQKVTCGYNSDKDKAIALFYWVRDNILYRVGNWDRKASETLMEKEGTCTNKSNLFVGLLRSLNIPAGYGIMKVYGQRYFGPVAIPILRIMVSRESIHVYTLVYLNNRWIKCDPSDDIELCKNTAYFNPTTKIVDWAGEEDAMLNLSQDDIMRDNFPIISIDQWMKKRLKRWKGIPIRVGNIYIKYIRGYRGRIDNIQELEDNFKKWLRQEYSLYFYIFFFLFFLRKLQNKIRKKYEKIKR